LWKAFGKFVEEHFDKNEVEDAVNNPNEKTPGLIAAWIFQKCERPDSQDSSKRTCEGATFSHALKMRAAVSYHYGQQEGRGSEKWHRDLQGTWLGNLALSQVVSKYMISLQKGKVPISHLLPW
jgi:hypothetical protein